MLTVLTPVYNRRYTMERLYESLRCQTNHNFEWLIIDDGSTDDLKKDVSAWSKQNELFPVRYHYVKNGGKHRAINLAVKLGVGDSVFVVDSDDYLAPHAIALIEERFRLIAQDKAFAGMAFPCYLYTENRRAGKFPEDVEFVDGYLNRQREMGMTGDMCIVFKRSVLEAYPFPEYEGENYVPEETAWGLTGLDGYLFRFYDEKLYFAEYLKDGLSRNALEKMIKNPQGWAAFIRTRKKYNYPGSFKMQYSYFVCMHKKFSRKQICELLEITNEEYGEYENTLNQFNDKVKKLLEEYGVSSIALYGFGVNAGYFLIHLKEIHRDIIYGIDRKAQYINYDPVYSPEEDLPQVDCVFITPGNCSKEQIDEIRECIRQKLPHTVIWSLKEIDDRIW